MATELLFQDIPSWFAVCTNEQCPLKTQCLRKKAGDVVMLHEQKAICVLPNQLVNGHCDWYTEPRTHQLKVGFTHLFDKILEKDATPIRQAIIDIFHGKRQYYWYLRGEKPLMPEQAEAITQIVRRRGSSWEIPFDGERETYVFPYHS